jgi:hypothetical protein
MPIMVSHTRYYAGGRPGGSTAAIEPRSGGVFGKSRRASATCCEDLRRRRRGHATSGVGTRGDWSAANALLVDIPSHSL